MRPSTRSFSARAGSAFTTTTPPSSGRTPVSGAMLAPWVATTRVPGPLQAATIARAPAVSSSRRSRKVKALLKVGADSIGLSPMSATVSRQRHHCELSTLPTGTSSARNVSPSRRACARPCSVRLRWVAQSSSRKPGGSPAPPTVAVWRMSATWPPARNAAHKAAASSSAAAGYEAHRSTSMVGRSRIGAAAVRTRPLRKS